MQPIFTQIIDFYHFHLCIFQKKYVFAFTHKIATAYQIKIVVTCGWAYQIKLQILFS